MTPVPNDWPSEVSIDVDADSVLLELVFASMRWSSAPAFDSYPPIVDVKAEQAPEAMTTVSWTALWNSRVEAIGAGEDAPSGAAATDPVAFAEWSATQPTRLSDLLSTAWPAEDFDTWRQDLLSTIASPPLTDNPEWLAGTALLSAWEHGLRRIVVLPVPEYLFRQISPRVALVSQETRTNRSRYSADLQSFGSQ